MQHDIKNVYSIQKYVRVFQKIYVRLLENGIQCGKNAHVIQQNKYCLSEKCT